MLTLVCALLVHEFSSTSILQSYFTSVFIVFSNYVHIIVDLLHKQTHCYYVVVLIKTLSLILLRMSVIFH